jgi:transcriptional regulator with GAF, ATPase, and Fis domain
MQVLKKSAASTCNPKQPRVVSESTLDRRSRWNWILISGTTVGATSVLAGVVAYGLGPYVRSIWPWESTQTILPVLLALLILVLVSYATHQQRVVARLRRQLHTHRALHHRRLMALQNVSRIMNTRTGTQPVFDAITQTCLDAYDCNSVSLMILDSDSEDLVVRSVAGTSSATLGGRRSIGEGISGWVADRRQAIVLREKVNEADFVGFLPRKDAPTASMVVPIVVRDELVGVLSVSSRQNAHDYDADDLSALEIFAENAGACIRHAEQVEWMRKIKGTGTSDLEEVVNT